jgi:hypothetical protein
MWDDATRAGAGTQYDGTWLPAERVLEELRLDPLAYPVARDRSLLHWLAGREAERRRQPIDAGARRAALDRLRTRHGLFQRSDLDRWIEANDLDAARLEQLIADEARAQGLARAAALDQDDRLLDDLRLHGDYARLAERARAKQALLASLGLDHPRPEDIGIAPAAVLAWYFEDRLQQPLPDDVDRAAADLGYQSRDQFYRALLREWLYCRGPGRGSAS